MQNNKLFFEKIGNFFKKYAWLMAIAFAVLAILFTLLPVVDYEIREKVTNISTGKQAKLDYVYGVSLITYITTGFKLNFTIYITLGIIVVGIILVALSKFKKDLLTAGGIAFLLAMCMFILSKFFFESEENAIMDYAKVVNETNAEQTVDSVSVHGVSLSWGAYLGIVFSNIAFACTTLFNQKRTTRQIVEEGILISLALILDFIKIPIGPTGGSINFQMLPLMIIALRYGPQHGFIAGGIVYGLVSCLIDGYGFACYPFDYLIGFGSVAALGFFRKYIFSEDQTNYNKKGLFFIFIGGLLSILIRYIGSNVSSIVVYQYSLKAALEYNSFYIPLSGLISIIALMAIYRPLIKINNLHKVEEEQEEEAKEVA